MAEELEAVESEPADDAGMAADNPTGDESSTALLPMDFFQGRELKPGSECKIRISRLLDGQAEVTYVEHEEPEVGEGIQSGGDEEMTGYMEA